MPKQAIREYAYAYAAVAPATGEVDSLILPNMSAAAMQIFLDELSARHKDELVLLFMDGAPSHHAGEDKLKIPENIRPTFQPSYSPEVNPSEHLWDEMREKHFRNRAFSSMEAVEKRLVESLLYLESNPDRMRSLTSFPWIEQALDLTA